MGFEFTPEHVYNCISDILEALDPGVYGADVRENPGYPEMIISIWLKENPAHSVECGVTATQFRSAGYMLTLITNLVNALENDISKGDD